MHLDLDKIVKTANWLINISRDLPSNKGKGKAGGYLTIGIDGMREVHSVKIGIVPDSVRWHKYLAFSQEKANRTYGNWLQDQTTISSWQSRDERKEKYGGAVLFPPQREDPSIISFSGFKEHVDEALGLNLGHYLGLGDEEHTQRVIAISNNLVFPEMHRVYVANTFMK